ncbi:hypothetical protein KM043_009351 [Ampulex compressa]|nr:hypothetical protein KM043_009351 [Ampulex compressa]
MAPPGCQKDRLTRSSQLPKEQSWEGSIESKVEGAKRASGSLYNREFPGENARRFEEETLIGSRSARPKIIEGLRHWPRVVPDTGTRGNEVCPLATTTFECISDPPAAFLSSFCASRTQKGAMRRSLAARENLPAGKTRYAAFDFPPRAPPRV